MLWCLVGVWLAKQTWFERCLRDGLRLKDKRTPMNRGKPETA